MTDTPVALVTGGSRGIGRAIALDLAGAGFDIATFNVSGADETIAGVEQIGRGGLSLRGDISVADDRAAALGAVDERFGRLDVLVNNAGVAPSVRADLLEADEASYDRVMSINLKGPYFLTQAVARWMVRRRRDGFAGPMAIVNISSISAYTASVARGEYCLSKAGLSMATQLFAARLAGETIGVYEIRPGIIATDMTAGVQEKYDKLIAEGLTPIRRWGTGGDVAKAVTVCATGQLPFSTGEVINVDGGFHLRTL